MIRKRIKLAPEKALFLFVGEGVPPTGALMSAVYETEKDEDGFLYVTYSGESTFGSGEAEDGGICWELMDDESSSEKEEKKEKEKEKDKSEAL